VATGSATAGAAWNVLLAGNYSEAQAAADYAELQRKFPELLAKRPAMIATGHMAGGGRGTFYQVRVSAGTRAEAEEFCEQVKAAGGGCVVLRS
jgi:hypothetical protein